MGASTLRRTARTLRDLADDLDRRAARLDIEADTLDGLLTPVQHRFTTAVWEGPAAGRAWSGYLAARNDLRRAALDVRLRAEQMRREARDHRRRAAELEAEAARIEAAERAAAAAAAAQEAQTAARSLLRL